MVIQGLLMKRVFDRGALWWRATNSSAALYADKFDLDIMSVKPNGYMLRATSKFNSLYQVRLWITDLPANLPLRKVYAGR
jgi:hypothetical protein